MGIPTAGIEPARPLGQRILSPLQALAVLRLEATALILSFKFG